jgi:uncharacterized protein
MDQIDLPLFPLGTVVFPGFSTPLHVFEPRYQRLLADCLMAGGRFGILGIARGVEVGGEAEPYNVGTLARITQVEELEAGHYICQTEGLERIRVLAFDRDSKPYLQGRAEIWPDAEAPAASAELTTRAAGLLREYVDALMTGATLRVEGEAGATPDLRDDARALSLLIAAIVQAPVADKQELLEAPGPAARLELEVTLLTRELALLKTTQAAAAPNPASLRGHFSNK